jgi:hypothetical protein
MVVVPAADDVTDGADVAEVSGGTDVTDHVDVIDVAVSGTCDVVVAVVVVVSAVVAGSAIVPVLDEAVGADGSAIGGPVGPLHIQQPTAPRCSSVPPTGSVARLA